MKYKYFGLIVVLFFSLTMSVFPQSSNIPEISASELIEIMSSDSTTIVLDVRNPEELVGKLGHIAGVINIPVHELEARLFELNKYKSKKISIICRSGNRSRYATAILNKNGFTAFSVIGGMRAYNKLK